MAWYVWVLAAAAIVFVVLLVVICLHCRNKGPLVSIRQANASEDYTLSTQFQVIHPSQQTTDQNSIHGPSKLLSPFLTSADPGTRQRQRSFTPTETESNPSYENPAAGPGDIESDAEDPGYIIVLPEGETPLTNQSRASTPSSDVLHDYENVPMKQGDCDRVTDEDRDYLNVEPLNFQAGPTPKPSTQSDTDDDDDDDEEEEEANYVNIHNEAQTD